MNESLEFGLRALSWKCVVCVTLEKENSLELYYIGIIQWKMVEGPQCVLCEFILLEYEGR
jgi:hypothetical protein